MSFVHVIFQTNTVRMWLDREENRVVFLLFSCYTQKLWEWFALLFALLVVPILAHTCWTRTFSCLSWERTVHYMIVLIPTVFLPYALVYICYLVTIFFIRIILEKFELTSQAHSWLFANIIVLCWLGSVHVYFYLTIIEKEPSSNEKCTWLVPSPTRIDTNFKFFILRSSTFGSIFGTVRLGHKLCDKDDNYTFSMRISRNENYLCWVHKI